MTTPTPPPPVDEAAVEGAEKIFEADWTILNVPHAKDVFARIITDAYADRREQYADRACPCLYGNPCSPKCTCVERISSFGCLRCCTYGSMEQRTNKAARLTAERAVREKLVDVCRIAIQSYGLLVAAHVNDDQLKLFNACEQEAVAALAEAEKLNKDQTKCLTPTPKPNEL